MRNNFFCFNVFHYPEKTNIGEEVINILKVNHLCEVSEKSNIYIRFKM